MVQPNKKGLLDQTKLLAIFQFLNERLKENQLHLELTIYGGSIMTLVYDNRPAAKDIACVFSKTNEKLLDEILNLTQFAFDLSQDWINEEVKEPLEAFLKQDTETFRAYSNLKVLKPVARQLLAMKLLAARPKPAKDFADPAILCKDLNIKTKSELLDLFTHYLPRTLLGERQQQFIKYLGEDLGYDWK